MKTQVEKLMELKQLYEAGILSKEEMEAEKAKILTSDDSKPKYEAKTPEPEPLIKEEKNSGDKEESFFSKYKYPIIVLVALFAGLLTYLLMSNSNSPEDIDLPVIEETEFEEVPVPVVEDMATGNKALKGTIGDNIGFTMHLTITDEIEGTEHYDSQKSTVILKIKSTKDNKRISLQEYDGQIKAGVFDGYINYNIYSGVYTSPKGKPYSFTAQIMSEEEFEKYLVTERITYKKSKNSIKTCIRIDFPIQGDETLMEKLRSFILYTLESFFEEEYKKKTFDGQTIVNYFGYNYIQAWVQDLENEEGLFEVIHNIDILKSFENDKFISYHVYSTDMVGGPMIGHWDEGATFNKSNGERVQVIASPSNKEFKNLLVNAICKEVAKRDADYNVENIDFSEIMSYSEPYLEKNGVYFRYRQEAFGLCRAMGEISFTLPYSKVKKFMTSEARCLIE